MRLGFSTLALAGLLCTATGAAGQPPVPARELPEGALAYWDFEIPTDLDGWTPLEEGTTLGITQEPADVRSGKGTVEFVYTPDEGYYLFQRNDLDVAGAASLKFAVKVSEPTPFLFGVGEEDGSAYDAFLQLPGAKWVDVAINLSDLQLRDVSDDENGQLDVDQVRSLVFFDLSNMPGPVGRALGWKEGEQRLWLDDITVSADPGEPLRKREKLANGWRITVDDFNNRNGLICGLSVGGALLDLAKADGGGALKITYRVGVEQWNGIVIGVASVDLAGLETVSLKLRAAGNADVNVVLEERDGSQYEHTVALKGGNQWSKHDLSASEFVLNEDRQDENGQLDSDQIRVVIVVVNTFLADVDATGTGSIFVDDIQMICGEQAPAAGGATVGPAPDPAGAPAAF